MSIQAYLLILAILLFVIRYPRFNFRRFAAVVFLLTCVIVEFWVRSGQDMDNTLPAGF